jgi:hypothetical protein
MRARFGGWGSKLLPNLDERAFNRNRENVVKQLVMYADYERRLEDLPAKVTSWNGATPHIVIVPMEGPHSATWKPAGGNFFYEISQSAREFLGDDHVTVFEVMPDEEPAAWHERLIRFLVESGATHVMAQIETDPNPPSELTWDVLWAQLAPRWPGVFLGVMFDSGFRTITLGARRLAKTSDRFMAVDICVPMDGELVKRRSEVGPVSMPISNETFDELDHLLEDVTKIHDVSFVGALYPYRVDMIEALGANGIAVAVNPHRSDETTDFASSRSNQPTYVDYMRGLAQSKITINFSMASSLAGYQLKTRILEATGVGTVVLTDDVDRSSRFWGPEEGVIYFSEPSEVPSIVARYLADESLLERMQIKGKARARAINVSSFWGGVEAGLIRRGLPRLREVDPTQAS